MVELSVGGKKSVSLFIDCQSVGQEGGPSAIAASALGLGTLMVGEG